MRLVFWVGLFYWAYGGMSFKKLQGFNIAMLGKQTWRMVVDTSSLVCRYFKARYFHSTSFMDADYGSNPSYIWRSLLAAQQMIHAGRRNLSQPPHPPLTNPTRRLNRTQGHEPLNQFICKTHFIYLFLMGYLISI